MSKHSHTLQSKEKGGFTLLETLVALMILSLSIVAPMVLASRTLFSATISREQITASYLAQEAIEGVRSARDTNRLNGVAWDTGIPLNQDFSINVVTTTAEKPTMVVCSGSACIVNYNSATNLFQHSAVGGTNQPSNFTRIVRVTSLSATELTVSVTVTWTIGGNTRTFTTRENLLNWQP